MLRIHYYRKFAVALGCAIVLAMTSLQVNFALRPQTAIASGNGITLSPPAFAVQQAADSTNPDFKTVLQEAGVTAYTKLDKQLNLDGDAARFKTVAKRTDQFISGIVVPPGYEDRDELEEGAEIQIYLHQDGWIVAYLGRWQPASDMIDWINYDESRLKVTMLDSVINLFAADEGISNFQISYYDFRNPKATGLVLASDRAQVNTWTDSFQISVPRGLNIYEASWSAAKYDRSNLNMVCKLEGEVLAEMNPESAKWIVKSGDIDVKKLGINKPNRISLEMDWWGNTGKNRIYCGIAMVYGQ